ncbi:trypsin-like peptidase domain-containing protein [Salinibacterium sp. SYSU T00001]|uniref:S1C family serine protease n=1 Tax=Homoserinimonas sedimenticola TaxID=2986805 RepID=UPI00223571D2|nr:trypsin-like peptidase domain-containing protein [Salinibacterium sedimenticola]MCW4386554.1 trypsin-like peptidase domain-containing protein [Salinibacterium sedimenticola]
MTDRPENHDETPREAAEGQPEHRTEDPTPPDAPVSMTPETTASAADAPQMDAPPAGAPVAAAPASSLPAGAGTATSTPNAASAPTAASDARTAGLGDRDAAAAPEKPKRSVGVGMIAVAAIAALLGGGVGAGVYAAIDGRSAPTSQSGVVGTNVMINDVDNATVISGVAATVAPSVVTLQVAGASASGSGSGVVLSEDGYILTNAHVATLSGAEASPTIQVQTYDGRLFDATLVGSDPIADLAVVKVDADVEFQPAEFADSDELNVGDTTIAIGAPLGLANTVTSGVVSALNRSITVASSAAPETEEQPEATPDPDGWGPFDFWEFDNGQPGQGTTATTTIALPVIQTDAAINPGNSGGALLDEDGNVIGINVAIASTGSSSASTAGSIGVGFAIPSNLAQRVASELIADGTASHGLLGATVADVTDDTSVESDVVGASIQTVTEGGAAEQAGLQQGDVVVEFNGLPITGKTDLTAQVRVLAGGESAELVYVRDGERNTVTVTLGELS